MRGIATRILSPFLAITALALWQIPVRAQEATTGAELATGIAQVREGEFDAAVMTLDGVIKRLATQPGQARELARSYTYLAIAYVGMEEHQKAKAKFIAAWNADKTLVLSPKEFPPSIIDLFEQARKEGEAAEAVTSAAKSNAEGRPRARPSQGSPLPAASEGGGIPYLGVQLLAALDDAGLPAGGQGSVVLEVEPQSPAEAAGLLPNDTILQFDGIAIRDDREFAARTNGRAVGDRVAIAYKRGDQILQVSVVLGDRIRSWQTACDEGLRDACRQLAWTFVEGSRGPRDPNRAVAMLRDACDRGHLPACRDLGHLYGSGIGVSQDDRMAVSLFERACNGGDASACAQLGRIFETGRSGIPASVGRAIAIFETSCNSGGSINCFELGRLYREGKGLSRNLTRALALFRQGCSGADSSSCDAVGVMFRDGVGIFRNESGAMVMFRESCEKRRNPASCALLADCYEQGTGIKKDKNRARELYRWSCSRGYDSACQALLRLEK